MVSWPVSLFASAAERLESSDYAHCLRSPYFPFYLNPFHSALVSSFHGNPQCPAHNPTMSSPSCPPGPLAPSPSLDPQPHGLLVLSFGCHGLPCSWTYLRGAPSVHTSVTFVPSHLTGVSKPANNDQQLPPILSASSLCLSPEIQTPLPNFSPDTSVLVPSRSQHLQSEL